MKVETQAEVFIREPVEVVFDSAFAIDAFSRILRPKPPIPGVQSVVLEGGATAVAAGVRRSLTMTDKSIIIEEVVRHDRPREHSYKWLNSPGPPLSLLVKRGEATWRLEPVDSGTRVVWTYWFELTSPLAQLPMKLVVFFFRRWMQSALDGLGAEFTRER
jgi:carbon monoxide dehydrogenase subunit G